MAKSSISLHQRNPKRPITNPEPLVNLAGEVCRRLGREGDALEITLVDDATSHRANRDFLGRDRPTNVISFTDDQPGHLGELIVNVDFARRESAETGYGLLTLIGYYIIHGLLHLAGYDHERGGAAEAASMEARESELRELLATLVPHEDGQ